MMVEMAFNGILMAFYGLFQCHLMAMALGLPPDSPKGIRQGAKAPRQLARLTPQTTRPHGRLGRSLTPVQRKFQVGTFSGGSWTFKSVGSNKSTQWKTITDYHSPFLSQFKSCQLSVGLIQVYILVGGWPTSLKNMSSSVGMMTFPIFGKS